MGLSVFENAGAYKRTYTLKNIYNIGRTDFLCAGRLSRSGDFGFSAGFAEGIAILPSDSNGDGGFLSSNAFPTYSPALSAVVGQFRTASNNLDVVAATSLPVRCRAVAGRKWRRQLHARNQRDQHFEFSQRYCQQLVAEHCRGDFKGTEAGHCLHADRLPLPRLESDSTFSTATAMDISGSAGGCAKCAEQ